MENNKYVTVLFDNDPILRKVSTPVEVPLNKSDKNIINQLLSYVEDSKYEDLQEKYNLKPAVGLAAPQIGINKQMIAIVIEETKDDVIIVNRLALVNPKIISHSEQLAYLKDGEGCLSVESVYEGFVPRYARISLVAYDALQEKQITLRASGYLAIVIQHELDHLKGILYYDRINKENPYQAIPNALVID